MRKVVKRRNYRTRIEEEDHMKFEFEYGQGTMTANLPDNTDVFIPGETVKDPAAFQRTVRGSLLREPGTSDWYANFNRVSA